MLLDDANQPLPRARLQLESPNAAAAKAARLAPCAGDSEQGDHATTASVELRTNAEGRFCGRLVDWSGTPQHAAFRLSYGGSEDFEGSAALVTVSETHRTSLVELSPLPQRLSLDRPSQSVHIETRVEPPYLAHELADRIGLELYGRDVLGTSRSAARQLWRGEVVLGQDATVEFETAKLGPPGPMELTVGGRSLPHISVSGRTTRVVKTAVVRLLCPGGPAIVAESGRFPITLLAQARSAPVTSGAVEVSVGSATAVTAAIVQGVARPIVGLESPTGDPVRVTVSYLPGAPWWQRGDDLELSLKVTPPSPWQKAPWIVAAALVALWMGRGWWPPPSARRDKPSRPALARGRPVVELVERAHGTSDWAGVVLDAHDQVPLEGVRVLIRCPSFASARPDLETITDAHGQFRLDGSLLGLTTEGAALEIHAPSHAALRRPLPPAGTLRIALVARRRALLDELVRWARRRGHPWWAPGEPTPAQVAREAEAQRAPETVRWARAVEQAAFGPDAPPERLEQELAAPDGAYSKGQQGPASREMPPDAS